MPTFQENLDAIAREHAALERHAAELATRVVTAERAAADVAELRAQVERLSKALAEAEANRPPVAAPAADGGGPGAPIELGDGDVLNTKLATRAVAEGRDIAVRPGAFVEIPVAGCTVKGRLVVRPLVPGRPGTLVGAGGVDYVPSLFTTEGSDGFTLTGLRIDCQPCKKGCYVLMDRGRNSRVTGNTILGEFVQRIVNAGQTRPSTGLLVEGNVTEGVLGVGCADQAVAGVFVNEHASDVTIRDNTWTLCGFAVRDMSGRGTRVVGRNAFFAGDGEYRSGTITIRPDDPAAVALVEGAEIRGGGTIELGYDTGKTRYRRLTVRGVTIVGGKAAVQVVGATNPEALAFVEDLVVRDWRGPHSLIDARKSPRGALRWAHVADEAGPLTNVFYKGRSPGGFLAEQNTRGADRREFDV